MDRGVPSSIGIPIRRSGPPFVIPAKSLPRTPIRGRNPEGRGWGMQRGRRLREARGLSPAGAEEGRGRTRGANSPYQATTPAFHTLVCRPLPA